MHTFHSTDICFLLSANTAMSVECVLVGVSSFDVPPEVRTTFGSKNLRLFPIPLGEFEILHFVQVTTRERTFQYAALCRDQLCTKLMCQFVNGNFS